MLELHYTTVELVQYALCSLTLHQQWNWDAIGLHYVRVILQ